MLFGPRFCWWHCVADRNVRSWKRWDEWMANDDKTRIQKCPRPKRMDEHKHKQIHHVVDDSAYILEIRISNFNLKTIWLLDEILRNLWYRQQPIWWTLGSFSTSRLSPIPEVITPHSRPHFFIEGNRSIRILDHQVRGRRDSTAPKSWYVSPVLSLLHAFDQNAVP